MLIKRVTLIYFSPTGGTLGAARLIAGEFRAPVDEIDITDAREPWARAFGPDELVVVAAPCYGGRVPAPAAQRLPHFSGRGTPAVAVVAFGNRAYDDALRELGDILTGNGFIPVAGAAIVTEHSLARQYGAGRPDESDRAELRAFAMKVRVKLGGLERAEQGRAELGDEAPYRQFGGLPVHPTAGRRVHIVRHMCARVSGGRDQPGQSGARRWHAVHHLHAVRADVSARGAFAAAAGAYGDSVQTQGRVRVAQAQRAVYVKSKSSARAGQGDIPRPARAGACMESACTARRMRWTPALPADAISPRLILRVYCERAARRR